MKVICIHSEIDDALARKVGLSDGEPRLYRSISQGKEYFVLGITYAPDSSCYAGFPAVEVQNDSGGISVVPIFMFDVLDASASKHWHIKFKNGVLTMLPESFYSDYYHDDLSEGVQETLEDFKAVCRKIESDLLKTSEE